MTKLSLFCRKWCLVAFSIAFVLIALAVAYQPVMFNFFCSDDFYIVRWLSHCKQNPMLLFQAVYEGTPYYRPLLNILLFFEYLLCGVNSVLFRAISLTYLLFTGFLLSLLFKEIALNSNPARTEDKKNNSVTDWCLFSAGFFLLYPLHTEPVNWFVCTTELLTTVFVISSFLLYLWWRKERKLLFALAGLTLAACAFLTKEIAVILPPILLVYEFLSSNNANDTEPSGQKRFGKTLLFAFKRTSIYWLLLIIYLCLRKMMTENFLGNWSNVVFHFSDNQTMYKAWLQSLKMIVVPLSSAAFGHNSLSYYIWIAIILGLAALTINTVWKDRNRIILSIFFVCWFFICLLPMIKLLWITPDLLDARYGYIASIPLCALLMYGLAYSDKLKIFNWRYPIFLCVIAFSCFVLHSNNVAWAEAGKLMNSLLQEFARLHKEIADDENIYLVNIPAKYKGVAIAGLKTLQCMNDKPFLESCHKNCNWLLNEDQTFPLGIMKNSIEQNTIHSQFFWLSNIDQKFHPVKFGPSVESTLSKTEAISKNNSIPIEINKHLIRARILEDLGKVQILQTGRPTFMWADKNWPCWSTDMLIFKVNIAHSAIPLKDGTLKMTFTNDIQLTSPEIDQISVPFDAKEGEQTIVVPMRGRLIWALGGLCRYVIISFPKGTDVTAKGAYAASLSDLMPKIKLHTISTLPGGKLFEHHSDPRQIDLTDKHRQLVIDYDARCLHDCAGVVLELLDSSQYFSQTNSLNSDSRPLIELVSLHPTGTLRLDRSKFSREEGYYKVRIRPIDKDHKQCGFCSDHFKVYVQH